MASMICASSTLNAQSSLVERPRITNSKYPRSSWINPNLSIMASSSYCVLNKNIFNSVKSYKYPFIQGEYGFSTFSSIPKISRVASAKSPSFNTITAQHDHDHTPQQKTIYDYTVKSYGTGKPVNLIDDYKGKILLIVNIPYQGSEHTENVYNMLHDLRAEFHNSDPEFEILGFVYDKKETSKQGSKGTGTGSQAILKAQFPLFGKVKLNKTHKIRKWLNDRDLWYFLRNNENCGGGLDVEDEFEMFLVDWEGIPVGRYPHWKTTLYPQDQAEGGRPESGTSSLPSSNIVKDELNNIYRRKKEKNY